MELRKKLTALRKKKGLSQLELADKLAVSRQAISKWEVGETVPSTSNLAYLARLYDVPLDYLINDDLDEIPTEPAIRPEAQAPADGTGKSRVRFWKRLAIGAIVLCAVLSAILFYIKISEKPGDSQNSGQMLEIKEGSITLNPDGGFDLEW